MAVQLITYDWPNLNGEAKDAVRLSLVMEIGTLPPGSLQSNWNDWMGHAYGTATLSTDHLFANCLSRAADAVTAKAYDITAFLDGSPHGSPYLTEQVTVSGTGGESRGNQLCAVVGVQGANYLSTPTDGPIGAIPTPEAAQDMGAPATHMGVTKLRSRLSGRWYLGPIDSSVVGVDGNNNPELTGTWQTNLEQNFAGFLLAQPAVRIWSRRNAAVYAIGSGWVDNSIATRRKKAYAGAGRTPFT